jgi:hypothetical protein
MDMLKFVEKENKQVGIETDMATGTGWPFGGPWVPISKAACKAVFVDTIVDVKQKLMEIEFNVPQKERAFAKLKVIKAFPVEGEKYKKRVIALYESRTRQKVNVLHLEERDTLSTISTLLPWRIICTTSTAPS